MFGCWALVPVKSTIAERLGGIDPDADADLGAIVHRVAEVAVAQPPDQPPHRFLGIGLDVGHVGVDHLAAIFAGHPPHLRRAARAGGDLGLEVGDVAVGLARRPGPGGEQGAHLGLEEAALVDQQYIVDQHAFLVR